MAIETKHGRTTNELSAIRDGPGKRFVLFDYGSDVRAHFCQSIVKWMSSICVGELTIPGQTGDNSEIAILKVINRDGQRAQHVCARVTNHGEAGHGDIGEG